VGEETVALRAASTDAAQPLLSYTNLATHQGWLGRPFGDDKNITIDWIQLAHQFPNPQFVLNGDIIGVI